MENNTLLPVEVVEQIENDSIERFPVTLTHGNHVRPILMQRAAYVTAATVYATKLHQIEQENAELRRQNDKLKEQATGWRLKAYAKQCADVLEWAEKFYSEQGEQLMEHQTKARKWRPRTVSGSRS